MSYSHILAGVALCAGLVVTATAFNSANTTSASNCSPEQCLIVPCSDAAAADGCVCIPCPEDCAASTRLTTEAAVPAPGSNCMLTCK